MAASAPPIDRRVFQSIDAAYRRNWRISLHLTLPDGHVVLGAPGCRERDGGDCRKVRAHAIEECLRWGEPTTELCPCRRLLWAVPVMENQHVLGGLLASVPERRILPAPDGTPALDFRRACSDLRRLAEEANLTNASALEMRRIEYHREQRFAEAIHDYKRETHYSLREIYLREEPALVAAIRRGDRGAARGILNRVLVGIHQHAGRRVPLVKSFFMELVTTMCRTAVEAGGHPEEILGANYASIAELSGLGDPEELAPWLTAILERILDSIRTHRNRTNDLLVHDALRYLREHAAEDISRDDAAQAVHLSPAHFSRLFRTRTGRTFTDMLNQIRIDRAAEMLARSDRGLSFIALECGFRDQSYFTKIFRRYFRQTPRAYREKARSGEA